MKNPSIKDFSLREIYNNETKCIPLHTGGGGVAPLVYVGTFTLSLFMFLEVFFSYSVLFGL